MIFKDTEIENRMRNKLGDLRDARTQTTTLIKLGRSDYPTMALIGLLGDQPLTS